MVSIGSRLKYIREKRGWSQTFVCKKLSIPNSTLSGYERDYRSPDPEVLIKLSDIYEVSVDWILGKEDSRNNLPSAEDLQTTLQALKEKRARWGARKLSDSEQEMLEKILEAVIKREEDEEDAEQ